MLNNLGERCNKILRFLLHATDYVSTLKIVRGKGIFIPPAEKISIDALADKRDERKWRRAKSAAIRFSVTFKF